MKPYKGINHLALATGDMDATIAYWRDLLGMRLVAGVGRPGYRHYFFELSENDMVAFFEWPGVEPLAPRDHGAPVRGPFAFDHISIGVAEKDDLWEIKGRLEAAGYFVTEAVDHGFIISIYTHDPNEIPLEFSWAVEGVDLRSKPFMADSEPTVLASEGPEPNPARQPAADRPAAGEDKRVYTGQGAELAEKLGRKN